MASALKELYTPAVVAALGESLKMVHPSFDKAEFQRNVFDASWPALELKDRMRHIAAQLHSTLDLRYDKALKVICEVAPRHEGFLFMLFPEFVQAHGLHDPERSLDALRWLTRFSSSEFAVRQFLLQDPKDTLSKLTQWAKDENHHVRRWCSEGSRPRLPWAMALPFLQKDPNPLLPILDALKNDPSEYVRRSVANNLNDISKDHPEWVIEKTRMWMGHSTETDRLLKHGNRTLLKKGNQKALQLFGVAENQHLLVKGLLISPKRLAIGEALTFSFRIQNGSAKPVQARIEYVVHFVKASGDTSPKVFQIAERKLQGGEETDFTRRHKLADLTTRKHYAGVHSLAIHVNGKELARADFTLTA
jgi:3-methyladenine DNA glycosylase AlkC